VFESVVKCMNWNNKEEIATSVVYLFAETILYIANILVYLRSPYLKTLCLFSPTTLHQIDSIMSFIVGVCVNV